MSENFDRALDALDEGLDLAAAPAWGEWGIPVSTVVCWRCEGAPPETSVGLCAACLTVMRDETTTAPEPVSLEDLIAALGPDAVERFRVAVQTIERLRRAYIRRMFLYGSATREDLLLEVSTLRDIDVPEIPGHLIERWRRRHTPDA